MPQLIQSVTFRLHDAVPDSVVLSWHDELASAEGSLAARQAELRKRLLRYEDAGHGACWLGDERIAALVEGALLHFDGDRYNLIAWCVMPNHVHVLVEVREGWPLATILRTWKSYSAHRCNEILGRSGEFWEREYHDRFVRDERHFRNVVEYVEWNPVKAGLAADPCEWRFSSARRRRG